MVLRDFNSDVVTSFENTSDGKDIMIIYNMFTEELSYDVSRLTNTFQIVKKNIILVCNNCLNGNVIKFHLVREAGESKQLMITARNTPKLEKQLVKNCLMKILISSKEIGHVLEEVFDKGHMFIDFKNIENNF